MFVLITFQSNGLPLWQFMARWGRSSCRASSEPGGGGAFLGEGGEEGGIQSFWDLPLLQGTDAAIVTYDLDSIRD